MASREFMVGNLGRNEEEQFQHYGQTGGQLHFPVSLDFGGGPVSTPAQLPSYGGANTATTAGQSVKYLGPMSQQSQSVMQNELLAHHAAYGSEDRGFSAFASNQFGGVFGAVGTNGVGATVPSEQRAVMAGGSAEFRFLPPGWDGAPSPINATTSAHGIGHALVAGGLTGQQQLQQQQRMMGECGAWRGSGGGDAQAVGDRQQTAGAPRAGPGSNGKPGGYQQQVDYPAMQQQQQYQSSAALTTGGYGQMSSAWQAPPPEQVPPQQQGGSAYGQPGRGGGAAASPDFDRQHFQQGGFHHAGEEYGHPSPHPAQPMGQNFDGRGGYPMQHPQQQHQQRRPREQAQQQHWQPQQQHYYPQAQAQPQSQYGYEQQQEGWGYESQQVRGYNQQQLGRYPQQQQQHQQRHVRGGVGRGGSGGRPAYAPEYPGMPHNPQQQQQQHMYPEPAPYYQGTGGGQPLGGGRFPAGGRDHHHPHHNQLQQQQQQQWSGHTSIPRHSSSLSSGVSVHSGGGQANGHHALHHPHPHHGGSASHGGGGGGGVVGSSDIPAGVLPSPEAQTKFRSIQWALLRMLALRRHATATAGTATKGAPEQANQPNVPQPTTSALRTAARYLDLPADPEALVSRPRKRGGGPLGSGPSSSSAAAAGGSSSQFYGRIECRDWTDVDAYSLPTVTEQHTGAIDVSQLPEEALAWLPHYSQPDAESTSAAGATAAAPADAAAGASAAASTAPLSGAVASTSGTGSVAAAAAGTVATVVTSSDETAREVASSAIAVVAAELVSVKRFKTKLCHSWLSQGGKCPRGDRCDYAHGAAELRSAGVEQQKTGKIKRRLCGVWLDTCGAFCPQADRCCFAHGVHELRVTLPYKAAQQHEHETAASASGSGSGSRRPSESGALGLEAALASQLTIGGGGDAGKAVDEVTSHIASLGGPTIGMVPPSTGFVFGQSHSASSTSSGSARDGSVYPVETSPSSASMMPPAAPRYKPHMCVQWLTGACQAAADIAAQVAVSGPEKLPADTGIQVRNAGNAACPRGSSCTFAHGIAELRLPQTFEQTRVIEDLFREPSSAPLLSTPAGAPGLNTRDQALMLMSSCLTIGSLPPDVYHRLREVGESLSLGHNVATHDATHNQPGAMHQMYGATAVGRNGGGNIAGAASEFIFGWGPDGQPTGPAIRSALLQSSLSAMLKIIIPAIGSNPYPPMPPAFGNGGAGGGMMFGRHHHHHGHMQHGMDPEVEERYAARRSVARMVAVVGTDAADVAVMGAAVALGLVPVRIPQALLPAAALPAPAVSAASSLSAPPEPSASHASNPAVDLHVADQTQHGQHGTLMQGGVPPGSF